MSGKSYAFFRGEFVPLEEANINIATHSLHYGTGVFEGIRGNWNETKNTLYLFRIQEHYERLLKGCQFLMLDIPYSLDDLCRITRELVKLCEYKEDIYIRPLAYKSAERIANLKLHDLASDFAIIILPFGNYVDTELKCSTSSWKRISDTMIPPRFKITGTYVNNILAKTEAALAGFDEAIVLNQYGYVSEGSGENIFVVMDGIVYTPPLADDILPGITRSTIIDLATEELGLHVQERHLSRSELYAAEECFMTGTAAHVTPVIELDNRSISNGEAGPVSKQLRKLYFEVVGGDNPKFLHWCTSVQWD